MPLIVDAKRKPFKKKAYRPWDLLGTGSPALSAPGQGQEGGDAQFEIETSTDTKYRHEKTKIETNRDSTQGARGLNTDKKYGQIQTPGPIETSTEGVEQPPTLNDRENTDSVPIFSRSYEAPVSISESQCPDLIDGVSAFPRGQNKDKQNLVSISSAEAAQGQIETSSGPKYRQTSLPTSPQQQRILLYLAQQQRRSGLGHTARMTTTLMAKELDIPVFGLRKQLARLEASTSLQRLDARRGRGNAGCVYRLPAELLELMAAKYRHEDESNKDTEMQTAGVSSSRSIHTPTSRSPTAAAPPEATETSRLSEIFKSAVETYGVEEHGFGADDMLRLFRRSTPEGGPLFESPEELLTSLEHAAFYLQQPAAENIASKKGFLLWALKQGYYPPPAGFVSFEERKALEKLEASRERLERLRGIAAKQYQVDFEIWLAEQSEEKTRALLRGSFADDPGSIAGRHVLMEAYSKETGRTIPK